MRKRALLLGAAIMLSFCAGCGAWGDEPSSSPPTSATEESAAEPTTTPEPTEPAVPAAVLQEADAAIDAFFRDAMLFRSWEGRPIPSSNPPQATNFLISDTRQEGDILTVTADLYGVLFLDPFTLEESTWDSGGVDIGDAPLLFATSVVRFEESDGRLAPVSCEYAPLESPGLDYLKAQTEKLAPELAASEKLDVSLYNKNLVEYVWRLAYSKRYIEKPEELTLYDLAGITEGIDLGYIPYDETMNDPDFRLDASLLRLLPNVESVTCYQLLEDYGVFENMNSLRQLRLGWPGDELFATLRIGHADQLWLDEPDTDMLDMTGINADALALHSYTTAVRGFKGCENLQKLYFSSTRTDMRLVNAETFPGLRYLNLYFYSDTPRFRDLSELASFQDVRIDLYLDYQACNNPTLESLAGVALSDVFLNTENGSYPVQDLDMSLVDALTAKHVTMGMTMYFSERTGDEPATAEDRPPVFFEGPDGAAYEAHVGEERGGWTLESIADYNPQDPAYGIDATFSGEATLQGTLRMWPGNEESEEGLVEFLVAEESAKLLPYYEFDARGMWFKIENGDMVREFAGADSGEFMDSEITISGFHYLLSPTGDWNSSSVKEIHRMQ